MKILKRIEFGNGVLREKARQLSVAQAKSRKVQQLIRDIRYTLRSLELGVGLAAPQVGEGIALSVISIQPTPHRPKAEVFNLVMINPVITETLGRKKQMWEGCISAGPGKAGIFAKVPRYRKVKVKFIDQNGISRHKIYEDLQAHVIQHEVDHLNGVLFVDKVKDTKTYTTYKEYMKIVKASSKG